jgi:hypothetical protein
MQTLRYLHVEDNPFRSPHSSEATPDDSLPGFQIAGEDQNSYNVAACRLQSFVPTLKTFTTNRTTVHRQLS